MSSYNEPEPAKIVDDNAPNSSAHFHWNRQDDTFPVLSAFTTLQEHGIEEIGRLASAGFKRQLIQHPDAS